MPGFKPSGPRGARRVTDLRLADLKQRSDGSLICPVCQVGTVVEVDERTWWCRRNKRRRGRCRTTWDLLFEESLEELAGDD